MGKRFLLGFVLLLPVLAAFLIPATVVHAAAFTVNTTADEKDANPGDGVCYARAANACTLRAAVQEANSTNGPSTITFLTTGQYILNTTDSGNLRPNTHDLEIANAITIVGPGQGSTLIVGSGDRVFDVENFLFGST